MKQPPRGADRAGGSEEKNATLGASIGEKTGTIRVWSQLLDERLLSSIPLNPMKINGYGLARVLTLPEIDKLFAWGLTTSRDRALFGICLHTGCRISEALALTTRDIQGGYITLKKLVTKGKRRTRMDSYQRLFTRASRGIFRRVQA